MLYLVISFEQSDVSFHGYIRERCTFRHKFYKAVSVAINPN
jgi:hypothetical protein